jgi:hypothetical protein
MGPKKFRETCMDYLNKEAFLPEGACCSNLRILGIEFAPPCKKDIPTLIKRNTEAKRRAMKTCALPVSWDLRYDTLRSTVCPIAWWGWWFHRPNGKTCQAINGLMTKAMWDFKTQGNPFLCSLFRGHMFPGHFCTGYQALNMFRKATQHGHNYKLNLAFLPGTWPSRISKWLKNLGFKHRVATWYFTHPEGHKLCITERDDITWALNMHKVRTLWRESVFSRFVEAQRTKARKRELPAPQASFCEARFQSARQMIKSGGHLFFRVLSGAFVSDARFIKMRMDEKNPKGQAYQGPPLLGCQWCGMEVVSDFEHVVWDCSHFQVSRPKVPEDWMQRRFGWPVTKWPIGSVLSTKEQRTLLESEAWQYDAQVIRHIGQVRETLRLRRYEHAHFRGGFGSDNVVFDDLG